MSISRGFRRRVVLLVAAVAGIGGVARAQTTYNWVGGTGNWATNTNWTPVGVPGSGDSANVTGTTTTSQTITYNYAGTAQTIGTLTVNLTGGAAGSSEILSIGGNTLSAAVENIGGYLGSAGNGVGTLNQSSGVNNVAGTGGLFLGYNPTDQGSYVLSSGILSAYSGASEVIGDQGTGTFIQTGGTNTFSFGQNYGTLVVALTNGASGTYVLSGNGLLSVVGPEDIGDFGLGLFNQSGGTNSLVGSLYVSRGTGAIGTYNLSGGKLSASTEYIGLGGTGAFNQTGGTNSLSNLDIAATVSSTTGSYVLSGGLATASQVTVGTTGVGTLHVGGAGLLSVSGTLTLGTVGSSAINLSGGTISVEELTTFGSNFNWSGGTLHLTSSNALIGTQSSAFTGSEIVPSPTLSSGMSLLLSNTASETIGTTNMNTTLTQTGGSNAAGTMMIAVIPSTGAGSLYNQTGGTNTLAALLGSGSYSLSGSGILNAGREDIKGGVYGFNQTGGTNTIGTTLFVHSVGNFGGSYYLNGGTLSSPVEIVGESSAGNGYFGQSGGTNSISGTLTISPGTTEFTPTIGSSNQYVLSGGTLSAPVIAATGGFFNQTGGTNSVTTELDIGLSSGNTGTFIISGGSLNTKNLNIGGPGSGVLSILGSGALTATGTLSLSSTTSSSVNLRGGTLAVGAINLNNAPWLLEWGSGSLDFTGGNLTIGATGPLGSALNLDGGDLFSLGKPSGTLTIAAGGALNLFGGTVNTPAMSIAGQFNWLSGTLNLTGTNLTVGPGGLLGASLSLAAGQAVSLSNPADALTVTGTLYLAGGGVNVSALNNSGQLVWSAGTLALSNSNLVVGSGGAIGSTLTLGPAQSLAITNPSDALNITGTLNLYGGAITAPMINNSSQFNWTSGSLTLTNSSLTVGSGGLFAPNLTIGNGMALSLTSLASSLNISGTLNLSGGLINVPTINDTGQFNWTSGSLILSNSNLALGAGGLVNTNISLNSGQTLALTNPTASLILNNTLTLAGGTLNVPSITNNGQFNWTGGTLVLSNSNLTLGDSSLISGSTVSIASGMALNLLNQSDTLTIAGTLNLSGGSITVPNIVENGQFNFTNGTLTLTNGNLPNNLFNGTISLSPTQSLNVIGPSSTFNGNADIVLQGGSLTVNYYEPGSQSSLKWSSGTLSLLGCNAAIGGFPGPFYSYDGLNLTSGQTLNVAAPYALVLGSDNYFELEGGTANVANIFNAGGDFFWNGGTLNVTGSDLIVGNAAQLSITQVNDNGTLGVTGANYSLIIPAGKYLDVYQGTVNAANFVNYGTLNMDSSTTFNLTNSSATIGTGGPFGASFTLAGGETLAITNSADYLNITGTLTLAGGTVTAPTITQSSGLFSTSGGRLSIGVGGNATTYNLTGGTLTAGIVSVSSSGRIFFNGGSATLAGLQIASGGLVNVNSPIMINYPAGQDPVSSIQSYITSGYNGGTWNGTGIASSAVAAFNASQSGMIYSIGYADGADGITGLSSGEIEILATLAGDAKLQGNVVFGDFQLLSQYFGQTGTSWDEGNFTYSSSTNFGDFQLLSQNFGANASALTSGEFASLDSFASQFDRTLIANPDGVGFSLVSVPEPASAGILAGVSGLLLLRTKRRNQRHSRFI